MLKKIKIAADKIILNPVRRAIEPVLGKTKVYRYNGFELAYERFGVRRHHLRDPEWIYEEEVSRPIIEELKQCESPVFLDIGSHMGFVSLNVLREVEDVKIFAFEPGDRQRELFTQTIALNKLEKAVTLYDNALGENEGLAEFTVQKKWPEADYSMGNGFFNTGRWAKTEIKKVQVKALDKWWHENGRTNVHCIKIDTEGAELMVLKGATQLIAESKPMVILEIQPMNLRVYPYSEQDILSWLNERGYELQSLSGQVVSASNIADLVKENEMFSAHFKSGNTESQSV